MSNRIADFIRSVKLRDAIIGALIGLAITAMLQPYAVDLVNDGYRYLGAPGYNPPDLQMEMEKLDLDYPEGEEIGTFGNITWRDDYEVYHLRAENKGEKIVRNLEIYAPLPGCIIHENQEESGSGGEYRTSDIIGTRMSGPGHDDHTKRKCSRKIMTDFLSPGESISIEYVTTTNFNECDILVGVPLKNPPEITADFRWQKSSSYYSEVVHYEPEGIKGEYKELVQNASGTGPLIDSIHGQDYVVQIAGLNAPGPEEVRSTCGIEL